MYLQEQNWDGSRVAVGSSMVEVTGNGNEVVAGDRGTASGSGVLIIGRCL